MGLRRVLCAIASICLIFTLVAAGLRSKKPREEEASVTGLINSLEKNEDVVRDCLFPSRFFFDIIFKIFLRKIIR